MKEKTVEMFRGADFQLSIFKRGWPGGAVFHCWAEANEANIDKVEYFDQVDEYMTDDDFWWG